ncbi:Uncharacterised protein [uncultured archaeon]|nr:Uncharacterised protein [uncultured archaeon]
MVNKLKEAGTVVKIDTKLLREVEDFIGKEENRLKFTNKKQFIDIAVFDFLRKMEKGVKE